MKVCRKKEDMNLYSERPDTGNKHRARYLAQLNELIDSLYRKAETSRSNWFKPETTSPEAYERSLKPFRRRFAELLGWPLVNGPKHKPAMREEFVAEDDLGKIFRVWIETLPRLETYGLLFVPPGSGPHPLVISQHGGLGTPELCSNLFRPANYNDMTRRVLRRGCMVFAPQLPLWSEEYGPPMERPLLDRKLKHLGGSAAALDIFQLQRSLDVLLARPDVDAEKVGMMGLSWGGFYTLVTAAMETRIRAALASAFLNEPEIAAQIPPLAWFNAASRFHLAEIAGLICPRPLYIEIGKKDEHVVVTGACREAEKIRAIYEPIGIGERYRYVVHEGGHEFGLTDDAIEFLIINLTT
jgi:hypothetical protein